MLQIFNSDIQCICSSSLHSEDTARLFLLSILDALCSECPTILVSAVITLQEAPFILDSSPDRNQGWLLDLPLLGKNTNYSVSVSLTRLDPSADEALNNSHQVWLPWCKGPPYLWLTSKWHGLTIIVVLKHHRFFHGHPYTTNTIFIPGLHPKYF